MYLLVLRFVTRGVDLALSLFEKRENWLKQWKLSDLVKFSSYGNQKNRLNALKNGDLVKSLLLELEKYGEIID